MPERVRVRYAPSPTGEPHVGNIRTALFNWLFARHHGGSFIVRIEDTDQERLAPGALNAILEALEWIGLDWDEGPTKDGGEKGAYGPYLQSHRVEIYHRHARTLLEQGHAYRCYCSPERLEAMRRRQQAMKQPPGYDGLCRNLSPEERQREEASGKPSVVRFKVPREGAATIHDLIRGTVTWENRLLDDFILLKSDGFPTYHLANVVDDHLMEISHIMRAEEWLPSAPRHKLLYDALGWEPPIFAHLPMILGADRSKLSKRHGATSLLAYRDEGYLPEAMVNFLALLGWSLDDRTEIISREDLVRHFSIERVAKAGAIFNPEKLLWMNGAYIRALSPSELAERLLPFLERPAAQGGLHDSVPRPLDREYLRRVVPLVQERLKLLTEGAELTSFFFVEHLEYAPSLLVQKGMDRSATEGALKVTLEKTVRQDPWDVATLEAALRPLAVELGLTTGQLFGVIRVAVTGRTASPPLFQTMEVLGRERCLRRLRGALTALARAPTG